MLSSPAACWTLALALGATIPLGACRQAIGIDQYFNAPVDAGASGAAEAGGQSACGLPYGTSACATCAAANCCGESSACAADATCASYQTCFGQCKGDPSCWSQCMIDHPAAGADVSTVNVCMASHCENECVLPCGAFAGRPIEPSTADACQSCLTTSACAETRACATSTDCDAIMRCLYQTCTTFDCVVACQAAHGVDPAYTFRPDGGTGGAWGEADKGYNSCGQACGIGADWACVGHFSWPPGLAPNPYTYHFWVKDYVTTKPVSSANVDVCGPLDLDCTTPFTTGSTDDSGEVSLQFQNRSMVGGQQLGGLNGYLRISAPSITTYYYYYWGFPLSESSFFSYTWETTPSEMQSLYSAEHVTPDPRRGGVAVAAYDCQHNVASGVPVTLSSADAMTQGFTTGLAPTTTTDQNGLILFTNVPAGSLEVTVTPSGLGGPSSRISANVRAGANHVVLAFPTP